MSRSVSITAELLGDNKSGAAFAEMSGDIKSIDEQLDRLDREIRISLGLDDEATAELKAGRAWSETGYVFATHLGTPQRGDNVLTRGLKPLMEKARLPRHNFQTLRRSNATFLVLLGVNPRVAMRWLGHSDVATTLRFYQQAPDELQERAARLMGELLLGDKTGAEDGV